MGFVARKKRSPEEVEEILRAFAQGASMYDISVKYDITQPSFYRILRASRGDPPNGIRAKQKTKIERLEAELRMREKEIRLLKEALKKS